jgi:hypothetical protein
VQTCCCVLREFNIVSYTLLLSLIEFKTLMMLTLVTLLTGFRLSIFQGVQHRELHAAAEPDRVHC